MEDARQMIAEMAAACRDAIRGSNEEEKNRLPKALHPKHLLWMCDQIGRHAQKFACNETAPLDWVCSSRDSGESDARP
jgi:hypothetical protein